MAQENNRKLCKACIKGTMDGENGVKYLTQELIKFQGDLNFSEKPYYRTALGEAVYWNQEQVAKFLIDKGVTINCEDYMGRTPLHSAAQYGFKSLCEFLLEKQADINKQDKNGESALHLATHHKRSECMQLFIMKGIDANLTDIHGLTAAHSAAFQGLGMQQWWLYCKGAWKNRFGLEDVIPATSIIMPPASPEPPKEAEKPAEAPPAEAPPAEAAPAA